MAETAFGSVIAKDGRTHCISAKATMKQGEPCLLIKGVTNQAAGDIRVLMLEAMSRHGFSLPRCDVTINLAFDVPFENTSELALVSLLSVAL